MQARFYDSLVGRFLSSDPVEFDGTENRPRFSRHLAAILNGPTRGRFCWETGIPSSKGARAIDPLGRKGQEHGAPQGFGAGIAECVTELHERIETVVLAVMHQR